MKRLAPTLLVLTTLALSAPAADRSGSTLAGLRVLGTTGGQTVEQKMDGFPLGHWDNGDQLFWTGAKPGDRLELALPVEKTGRQHLAVVLTKGPDYGIVQFSLDGQKVGGQIDLWSPWVGATPPVPLAMGLLRRGRHTLAVELIGANKESKGLQFGLDRIVLEPAAPEDPAARDETSSIEGLYRLERLPRFRPDETCAMWSSYDRTGGNNDGFGGTYSKLWIEDGHSVLAVMSGAGSIERIWFTHSTGKPGLLDRKKEHVKIYLDGQPKPALDVPLEDVFSGRLPQFPKPLVGEGQGGFYCYVPIAYRDGCKVVVEGTGVRFFQITYRTFPSARDVRSFSMDMSPERKEALDAAVRLWSNLGEVDTLGLENAKSTDVDVKLVAANPSGSSAPGAHGSLVATQSIALPPGPRMIRAVLAEGTPEELKAATGTRLAIWWDGAEKPAVELPLEYFFCQALDTPPYRSVLTGTNESGWYNFVPMPYRRQAKLQISTDAGATFKLRIVTTPISGSAHALGYLHTAFNESVPTKPNVYHPFLTRKGAGHYVGTYLATEGQTDRKIPLWLEGDERFTVDGRLVIHGTGSEDYFNCGWYALRGRLNGPGAQPLHGFPAYGTVGDRPYAAAFRWHLSDPVPWQSSIRAEIEHGADNRFKADYRSVAFFYEPTP